MTVTELVQLKRDDIKRIAAAHGAHNVRVFGSVARQEAGSDSDVDLLIDLASTPSPWFPAGLILDLQELLGHRVDIVTERALHTSLRDRILREAVPL
ncbi:MAG: nucleotidyltransferase family protein [Candidatus Tectomicrobia bacterium]|nr:nucleotidyltransferase family protein [Candidatus Tectomicrobia bacterium]